MGIFPFSPTLKTPYRTVDTRANRVNLSSEKIKKKNRFESFSTLSNREKMVLDALCCYGHIAHTDFHNAGTLVKLANAPG